MFNTSLPDKIISDILSQIPLTISTGKTSQNEVGKILTDINYTDYGLYVVDASKFGGTGYFLSINNGFEILEIIYITEYSIANLDIARALLDDQSYTYTAGWQVNYYDLRTNWLGRFTVSSASFTSNVGIGAILSLSDDYAIIYADNNSTVTPVGSSGTEL